MNPSILTLLSLITLCSAAASPAIASNAKDNPKQASPTTEPLSITSDLLSANGGHSFIKQLQGQFKSIKNETNLTTQSPSLEKAIIQTLTDSFQAPEITQAAQKSITQNFQLSDITNLRNWFRSPLGKAYSQSINTIASEDFNQDFLRYVAGIKNYPPSHQRILHLAELSETSNISAIRLHTTLAMQETLSLAIARAQLSGKSAQDIKREIEAMEQLITTPIKKQSLLLCAYLFRNQSDQTLADLTTFHKSNFGQIAAQINLQASKAAMEAWKTISLRRALKPIRHPS